MMVPTKPFYLNVWRAMRNQQIAWAVRYDMEFYAWFYRLAASRNHHLALPRTLPTHPQGILSI